MKNEYHGYQPIQLTEEEATWIDKQVHTYEALNVNNNALDAEVKKAFDDFYDGIVELYKKYPTKMLNKFYATGFNYDGFMPTKNRNFMLLYEELIFMVKDKVIDKPVKYFIVEDEKLVPILEYEDGTIEYLE